MAVIQCGRLPSHRRVRGQAVRMLQHPSTASGRNRPICCRSKDQERRMDSPGTGGLCRGFRPANMGAAAIGGDPRPPPGHRWGSGCSQTPRNPRFREGTPCDPRAEDGQRSITHRTGDQDRILHLARDGAGARVCGDEPFGDGLDPCRPATTKTSRGTCR